ncbi:glycosyltransferase involved in cell wall biosynthesis [Kushneria sinocarnis]|uniref:Glycosyltransferase involved in cell wall biosynthesis n=1 Tax=Kushneria sinocarnis TaxID=595502 RepID=A0A420WV48_9GAMM|nr:glycosyltransferase family 4 protein [Kushneria sinocarnis]RKR02415.1 glycosyltransferase involved in cell wall biosynthesis [Kushneria sinocarnis]
MNPDHPDLTLIVAGSLEQLTGGYIYDARIVEGLRARGSRVEVIGLEGRFPETDDTAASALDRALAAQDPATPVVIDGLAMGALPEVVERHRQRLTLVALLHHPLTDESGLSPEQQQALLESERRALAASRGVIVTSDFTARRLTALDMADIPIRVVRPGVDPAPLTRGSVPGEPLNLLCVATLIPRKRHLLLVEALAELSDRSWHCHLVGDTERDDECHQRIRDTIRTHGLSDRITLHGAMSPRQLGAFWETADLFVLPSCYEGYGMVIDEALARGVPIVTTTGGALADTLPAEAGLAVPPDDPAALTEALARVIDDSEQRQRLAEGARQARAGLPDWHDTADQFHAALETLITPAGPAGS